MTAQSPIRSQAQHTMLTKAASDPDYAKQRGIMPEAAQALLDGHKAAGAPELPDRVDAPAGGVRAGKTRGFKFTGLR